MSHMELQSDSDSDVCLSKRTKFKKRKRNNVQQAKMLREKRVKSEDFDCSDSSVESEDSDTDSSEYSYVVNKKENGKKKQDKSIIIIRGHHEWSMFVQFSQTVRKDKNNGPNIREIFSEKWNPYEAGILNVAVYLAVLSDVCEFKRKEILGHKDVLRDYLPQLELDGYNLDELLGLCSNLEKQNRKPTELDKQILTTEKNTSDLSDYEKLRLENMKERKSVLDALGLSGNQEMVVPPMFKGCMMFTNNFTRGFGRKIWSLFLNFCYEKTVFRNNPFLADARSVRDFIEHLINSRDDPDSESKNVLKSTENFFVDNIIHVSTTLGNYLKIGYAEDLVDSDPIKELLEAGKRMDGRIPLINGLQLKKLNPRGHDFTQYSAMHGEGFWELEQVGNILKDVSIANLGSKQAAWFLGITEDMVSSALQFGSKDPECSLTMKLYIEKGFGNEAKFWKELSTEEVLNEVRNRKVVPKDAAFKFGVSRSKLLQKVGTIKSEDKIKEEKVQAVIEKRRATLEYQSRKPTELDKQILVMEKNINDLSDYEKMRLENMKERKSMLEALGIAEDKKELKKMSLTANAKNMPVDYGTREKSSRIKRKLEEFVQVSQVMDKKIHVSGKLHGHSPPWVGQWYPCLKGSTVPRPDSDFNQISPVPQVTLNVKEVISNLDYHRSTRFMNSISEEFEETVLTERLQSKSFPREHTKIADSIVSSFEIRSVDTLEDLVCYGDSAGGVGVFLDGRSTTLKVHNEPVTRTLFLKHGHGDGILSGSQDGTVRLTDLVKQEVSMKYSWIQSGAKEQIGWIEPWDGHNFLINTNRNSLKRIDLRNRNVDNLVSLSHLDFLSLGYLSESELLLEISNDPSYGANIGVHPCNRNLVSFCHESSVKIFDLRNTGQPVSEVDMSGIKAPGRLSGSLRGISGANWSPSGEHFLVCPLTSSGKLLDNIDSAPYIFESTNLEEPIQVWGPKKGQYMNTIFSHYYGASWCPWQKDVFLTTAVQCRYKIKRQFPSSYTVVAIDGTSGAVVGEIGEDLDNSGYLITCHKTRAWVVVGNARGPGDLVIFKSTDE